MEEKKYPYLGEREYKGEKYVVLFTEKNYGVVVMSNIEEIEELKFGKFGDFNEDLFTYLEKDVCVRLSN